MGKYLAMMAAALATSGAAGAQDLTRSQSSPLLQEFARCRAVADAATRAECYDAAWDAFERARRAKQVVVLDNEDVKRTRRGLFGFGGVRLPFLGGEEEGLAKVESKINAASELAAGRWQFTLEDDAVWQTTEPLRAGSVPRNGMRVTLTRGAIGSYFARFGNGSVAIRAKRMR